MSLRELTVKELDEHYRLRVYQAHVLLSECRLINEEIERRLQKTKVDGL